MVTENTRFSDIVGLLENTLVAGEGLVPRRLLPPPDRGSRVRFGHGQDVGLDRFGQRRPGGDHDFQIGADQSGLRSRCAGKA